LNLETVFSELDRLTGPSNTKNTVSRFKSYNWNTISINGHNPKEIARAIKIAKQSKKPSLISCKTKIGFGSPNKEGKSSSHGAPLGEDEIKLTRKKLKWDHKPFMIPKKILEEWNSVFDMALITSSED
jgi:transketolase